MLYVENNSNDPTYNLAFEEYLFRNDEIKEPVLLLWQNGPSVIIGRYQNALEEVDFDYLEDRGIALVRRSTGGGAVYHDLGNLNFSFIVPRTDEAGADMASSFEAFSRPVLDALRSLGVKAECSGRNDLIADGCKFSGCAQQRSRKKILHHGTLMFDLDLKDAASVLKPKPGKFKSKSVKSVRSRITNLKPILVAAGHREDMNALDLKALLLEHFRREYDLQEVTLRREQLDEVEKICSEKYGSDSWNLGRSPKADITRGDFFPCGQIEFHFCIEGGNITDVKITGDFFSTDEDPAEKIAALEHRLCGIPYERSAIQDVLEQTDLVSLFGDITPKKLTGAIV